MTVVYVIAAEGGHVRIGASAHPDEEARVLRRRYRMEFEVAYRSRPTPAAVDIARGARQALAGARVVDGWFDATPAAAVAAIEAAEADLRGRPRDASARDGERGA